MFPSHLGFQARVLPMVLLQLRLEHLGSLCHSHGYLQLPPLRRRCCFRRVVLADRWRWCCGLGPFHRRDLLGVPDFW